MCGLLGENGVKKKQLVQQLSIWLLFLMSRRGKVVPLSMNGGQWGGTIDLFTACHVLGAGMVRIKYRSSALSFIFILASQQSCEDCYPHSTEEETEAHRG